MTCRAASTLAAAASNTFPSLRRRGQNLGKNRAFDNLRTFNNDDLGRYCAELRIPIPDILYLQVWSRTPYDAGLASNVPFCQLRLNGVNAMTFLNGIIIELQIHRMIKYSAYLTDGGVRTDDTFSM
jgi:hypothetical protein